MNSTYLFHATYINTNARSIYKSMQTQVVLFYLLAITALVLCFSSMAAAQGPVDKATGKVVPIGTAYQNSIKLLNNRFRVDSDVSEVTLIFFREYGSAPVVLVRPDGSKLFLENDANDDSYEWYETDTYDMIALYNPMPGPWQAVGQILPESRVMVIAGITLNADPIPYVVFSGETLKQTALLENAGEQVDLSQFRDVVSLSIDFVSTNNPSYPNFGLGSRTVARFEDNGVGFDEEDGDGVFTGQFNLAITEGEWRPIFTVRTPLFSREQMNDNVVLLPNPVILSHTEKHNEDGDHLLTIDVNREHVQASSLLVDGTVRHPNGEVVRFSVTEVSDKPKLIEIINTDYGIYKINMTVFATTVSGRDIVLSVPEYSFVTEAPPIEVIPADEEDVASDEIIEEALPPPEESMSTLTIVIIINVIILIFGVVGLVLLVDKRNKPNNHISLKLWRKLQQIDIKKIKLPSFKKSKPSDEPST